MVVPLDIMDLNAKHLSSALQHPTIIDESLKKEIEAGRILGPFDDPPLPNLRCSGLGAIPENDGGWWIIYHLSAPPGLSINDFIDSDSYSLLYCSVDDAYTIINELGTVALLSKIDLKHAFRLIPVQQSDWNLLGIHGRDRYYIDTCLPFGRRSAPLINLPTLFTGYYINSMGFVIRYTTWTIFSLQALPIPTHAIKTCLTCCLFATELAHEKVEGPTTRLIFLGIVLNTITMEASISTKRKSSLLTAINSFRTSKY